MSEIIANVKAINKVIGVGMPVRSKQYYHELSAVDRGKKHQISALLVRGILVSKIAKIVRCHRSTVYRELKGAAKACILIQAKLKYYQSKNSHHVQIQNTSRAC